MTPEIAARLENLNIQLMAEAKGYCMFVRGDLMAMAYRSDDGSFRSLGSSGILTENGLAYLVLRGEQQVLATHGGNLVPASAEQAETVQRFSADLKAALGFSE